MSTSELAWITRYAQELDELALPLPSQVTITGPRAAGFAQVGDTLEITVIAETRCRSDLERRIAESAAAATKAVPCMRPKIKIQSCKQWDRKQAGEAHIKYRSVWLPPDDAPRQEGM